MLNEDVLHTLKQRLEALERAVAELRQRIDQLAPPLAKCPPKAQGLRQDEVGKRTDAD